MLFVIYGVGVAAGIGCVFVRHPVFLLIITVCPLLAAGALLSGIRFGTPAWLIVVEVFGSIAAPQVTFMAVSLAHFALRRYRARARARFRRHEQLSPISARLGSAPVVPTAASG